MSIFSNAGQVCAAGSRLFVQEAVADEVLEGIVAIARGLRVGQPLAPDTQVGPLITQVQLDRVTGYVQSGLDEGAKLLVGGQRIGTEGYFMQPTVFVETRPEMRLVREEIFGPVLAAVRFENDSEIGRLAELGNATPYGLSASIFTKDLSNAHRLARRLKAGTVRVNGGGVDVSLPLGGYKALRLGPGKRPGGGGSLHGAQGGDCFALIRARL